MDATQEEWRPVVGWEADYEVSNLGRVRSLPMLVGRGKGQWLKPGQLLNPKRQKRSGKRENREGYWVVTLHGEQRRIQTLVAEAFLGPRPDGLQCLHRNDDSSDNRAENLYWGTDADNRADSVRNGRHHYARRSRCKHGHEFTPENTYRQPSRPNVRHCNRCRLERQRSKRAAA